MTALGATVAEEVRETGIRITSIFPGEVNTPILDKRPIPLLSRIVRRFSNLKMSLLLFSWWLIYLSVLTFQNWLSSQLHSLTFRFTALFYIIG